MTREFIVYNCKDVLISFGPYSLTGYADDGFLTIEAMARRLRQPTDAMAQLSLSIDPNASAKVTLTNLYGVKANRILAGLAAGLRDGELKTYPLLIKKKTGELLLSADIAWVAKMPNSDFGKSGGNRQWVIYTAESERGDV